MPESHRKASPFVSHLPGQDSYSYELAQVFVAADSVAEMEEKYDRAVAELTFEFGY